MEEMHMADDRLDMKAAGGGLIPTRRLVRRLNLTSPIVEPRRTDRYPMPLPNSWFFVCTSADLPRGALRSLRFCGHDVVAFRGEDGKARVVEAYCPHLGAHLGE